MTLYNQIVATKHRCRVFHENGRENRNNGNQEKGKEEKEALTSQYEVENKRGRGKRPLSFCAEVSWMNGAGSFNEEWA
jgi:hypothetical protein